MSDRLGPKEAGAVWRDQPEEKTAVNLQEIMNRRTQELHASTRSEIVMSVGAALFFLAVIAVRLAPPRDLLQDLAFAAVAVWAGLSLYWFRDRIWRRSQPPDALAATGLEHYRRELERRRDHLRNEWLWHGPLVLACIVFAVSFAGKPFPGTDRMRGAWPLILLLAAWTAYGIQRRRRQARQLQAEIDELNRQ
jgi:hypothetical protein